MSKLDVIGSTEDIMEKRAQANDLAQYLINWTDIVQGIEIFGSLSRGQGHQDSDFDMIILVDGALAANWLIRVRNMFDDEDIYESKATIRKEIAFKILGLTEEQIEEGTGITTQKQDYFLFPKDWRRSEILDALQRNGRHDDPDFIRNIAQDALAFVPGHGFPFPAPPRIEVRASTDAEPARHLSLVPREEVPVAPTCQPIGLTEFVVDPENHAGTLFISDVKTLFRPALPGQHYQVAHDTDHTFQLLELGHDRSKYNTHILFPGSPQQAAEALSVMFEKYLNQCCFELWCGADVEYRVGDMKMITAQHGFLDGSYMQRFTVHCRVQPDKAEEFLRDLTFAEAQHLTHFMVVRPDSSELGYEVRGFAVNSTGVAH